MKQDEKLLGSLRLAVAGYWMMGFGWGWVFLKLPDTWFLVMLILSCVVCGLGGWLIEKIHKKICEIEVLRASKNDYGHLT